MYSENLNGWIGDRTRAGITSAFRVPGESDNGKNVMEVCAVSGGKEHNRSNANEEVYAALCAECEGNERNGTRPLRSLCCTV